MAAMPRNGTTNNDDLALAPAKGEGRGEGVALMMSQHDRPIGSPRPALAWFRLVLMFVLLVPLLAMAGCDNSETIRRERREYRIVSLSPALTQIILDLELREKVVGVGRFGPLSDADDVAVVGDLRSIDREKLVSVRPTDIFVQTEAGDVPAGLRELATQRGWRLHTYKIETIGDIREAISDYRGGGIGAALGVPVRAVELRGRFNRQLAAVADAVGAAPPPRVMLLVGSGDAGQVTAAGVDTFLDQVLPLVNALNALNEFRPTGEAKMTGYPALALETVVSRTPDLVVVVSPHDKPEAADGRSGELMRRLSERAGDAFEVRVLSHRQALLPSTRLPEVVAELAKVIHPDKAERIDAALAESTDEPSRDASPSDAESTPAPDPDAAESTGAAP